ncbi:MAG: ion channel [Candidatus Korobacteraceae bacterium]
MPATSNHRRVHARELISHTWQSQANLSLFLALLVIVGFVLPSLGFGRKDLKLYSDIVFSVMLISGVAIAWGQRVLFSIAALVAGASLVVRWLAFWKVMPRLEMWGQALSLAAVMIIALVLLAQVFRAGAVTQWRIQGAIAVYLLFGVGWAHAYQIVATLQPGSFNHSLGELSTVADWAYYSYITLTTVGYGDITPVSPIARNLAVSEALAGQLYLAVLVARLVAMEVIAWQENASRRPSE